MATLSDKSTEREEAVQKATSKTTSADIYQLKITLRGIRPPIWRRVLVPAGITLPKMHDLIATVMGWHGGHMHAFRVGNTTYGEPDPQLEDWTENEKRVRLSQIAPEVKSRFLYDYDFGDDWQHLIVVEKILPAAEGQSYPVCITGKRACPPEDCGGPWGYAEFLEAIADPDHEEHANLLDWIGGEFDAEAFDLNRINTALQSSRS